MSSRTRVACVRFVCTEKERARRIRYNAGSEHILSPLLLISKCQISKSTAALLSRETDLPTVADDFDTTRGEVMVSDGDELR